MKVAIVNDSKAAAEVLRRILAEHPEFELLWTAYSGEEAIELCKTQHPDIILMDLIMPGIGGAETTRRIMKTTPCVILVVTATTVGNRAQVFEAMGNGALDAVNTPTLGTRGDMSGAEPLLQKLRMVSRLVAPHRPPRTASGSFTAQLAHKHHETTEHDSLAHTTHGLDIVAIGASTGGPEALAQVLSSLPAHFPAAVLITQHVDQHFAPGLATWLQDRHSALPVKIAKHGEHIHAGGVWIAGSNDHMAFEENSNTLYYTPDPIETPYRPSVDVLFSSLARPHRARRIGVLLTGMGRDGAEGLLALRNANCLTIAQDAATSVVYGMPKAAAELNAAVEILGIGEIGPRVRDHILKNREVSLRDRQSALHKPKGKL